MSKKTILVTGGAGFIGSMVNLMLADAGYATVILDNLSSGDARAVITGQFIQGDLKDKNLLEQIFKKHSIDAVMHFAALTDVGESVLDPEKYYDNNVTSTLVLFEAMKKADVKNLIFSSSAAVYGIPKKDRIDEKSPCHPINPYGETKWIIEKILKDYGLKSCSLRYFNAAGGDPSFRLKHFKKKENNLIPIVLNSIKNQTTVTIYGEDYPTPDGTCLRDYIHVYDLGKGHILALEKLFNGNPSPCYNLGCGKGYSVREVIRAAEEVTKHPVKVALGPRREGDPPILLADASLAQKELGWVPEYPKLTTMIEHAWKART